MPTWVMEGCRMERVRTAEAVRKYELHAKAVKKRRKAKRGGKR